MDLRVLKLAENLIRFSVHLQKNEKLLIECYDQGHPLVKALVKEAYKVGGLPFVWVKNQSIMRDILLGINEEYIKVAAKTEMDFMDCMDAYIGFRGFENFSELSDIPKEQLELYQKHWWYPVHVERRVEKTKWCILRWPSSAMAQMAKMPTEVFEDFFFKVSTLNYQKMEQEAKKLVNLMNQTDKVRLVGSDTNLSFSIKNIGAIACCGHMNIPDGEVYSAPVKHSVEGTITFNAPSPYNGIMHNHIQLTFKEGKIIKATSSDTNALNQVLDTDEGARYIGEFAIGFNPYITEPFGEILFDEKIAGSIHFTPGSCYADAFNGNKSAVHWDMVFIQRTEYGGGEIYFDDVLIRKDGMFVHKDLLGLNPDFLKS